MKLDLGTSPLTCGAVMMGYWVRGEGEGCNEVLWSLRSEMLSARVIEADLDSCAGV